MKRGDKDYRAAYDRLTSSISDKQACERVWVEFLCEDLPKFDADTLRQFLDDVPKAWNKALYSRERQGILLKIWNQYFAPDIEGPTPSGFDIAAKASK